MSETGSAPAVVESVRAWQADYLERMRRQRGRLVGRARLGLRPPRRDRTAVVTDSSAALPGIVRRHPLAAGVRQVPMPVMVGEQIYTEGSDELQRELPFALASGTSVRTSRPSPGRLLQEYRSLAADGYARIVSVHLSGELSGTAEAARLAARESPVPVRVVDSRSAGFAQGLLVVDAAVQAGFGCAVDAIVARLDRAVAASSVLFTVPNLEQLRRGGRISALSGLLGSVFQVKPVLGLRDGGIVLVEKPRSTERAVDRLVAHAAERAAAGSCQVAVHGYGNRAEAEALAGRLQEHAAAPIPVIDLPAVLAAHLGLGALGVIVVPLDPDDDEVH